MKTRKTFWIVLASLLAISLILAPCGGGATPTAVPEEKPTEAAAPEEPPEEEPVEEPPPAAEATALSLWYHGAGNPEERAVILQIIEDFNASQGEYVVEVEDFPAGKLQRVDCCGGPGG